MCTLSILACFTDICKPAPPTMDVLRFQVSQRSPFIILRQAKGIVPFTGIDVSKE